MNSRGFAATTSRSIRLSWPDLQSLFVATFDQIEPFLTEETKAHLTGGGKECMVGRGGFAYAAGRPKADNP